MATVRIDFQSSGEAGLKGVSAGLDGISEAAKRTNAQIGSSASKYGQFADSVGKVSTTMARSASAFGLPVAALRSLDDVADIAEIGLKNLTTTMVGFNAASVGVAGAGLAIGAAIGTWLRTFPAVSKAADDLASSLYYLATGITDVERATGRGGPVDAAKNAQTVIAAMKAQGMSLAEIKKHFGEMPATIEKVVDSELKLAAAAKEAAKADHEAFEAGTALATNRAETERAALEKLEKATKEYDDALFDIVHTIDMLSKSEAADFWEKQEKQASDAAKSMLENIKKQQQAQADHIKVQISLLHDVGDALSNTADLFVVMGFKADSALIKVVDGLSQVAHAAGNVFTQLASGNILGAVAAGIGGVVGLFKGLFGHAKKARQEVDLIAQALKTDEEATKKLNEAMQRYSITVDEMGPKFAQQELDKQAMALYQDYMLLTAAGADHNVVLSKMAPNFNEYLATVIKAGSTVPTSLKPMVEEMLKLGLLTDASGEAFHTAEEAGITFAQSLEEGINSIIASVDKLVKALERLYGLGPPPSSPGLPGVPNANGEDSPPPMASGGYVHSSGLAFLHAGETVMPTWNRPPLGEVELGGDPFDRPLSEGGEIGGGGGVTGGPSAVERIADRVAQKIGRPQTINVRPTVQVDASFVPAAFRQQTIEDIGREVGRTYLPGRPNYRFIQQAVRAANAEG